MKKGFKILGGVVLLLQLLALVLLPLLISSEEHKEAETIQLISTDNRLARGFYEQAHEQIANLDRGKIRFKDLRIGQLPADLAGIPRGEVFLYQGPLSYQDQARLKSSHYDAFVSYFRDVVVSARSQDGYLESMDLEVLRTILRQKKKMFLGDVIASAPRVSPRILIEKSCLPSIREFLLESFHPRGTWVSADQEDVLRELAKRPGSIALTSYAAARGKELSAIIRLKDSARVIHANDRSILTGQYPFMKLAPLVYKDHIVVISHLLNKLPDVLSPAILAKLWREHPPANFDDVPGARPGTEVLHFGLTRLSNEFFSRILAEKPHFSEYWSFRDEDELIKQVSRRLGSFGFATLAGVMEYPYEVKIHGILTQTGELLPISAPGTALGQWSEMSYLMMKTGGEPVVLADWLERYYF